MRKIAHYSTGGDGVIVLFEEGDVKFIPKEEIAETFEKYGGSFTKAIGTALYRADLNNTQKILDTWSDMIKEYIGKFMI